MTSGLDQLALVTAFIFIVGLVYDAGRKAQRLDMLEEWKRTMNGKLDKITDSLLRLERLIVGTEE